MGTDRSFGNVGTIWTAVPETRLYVNRGLQELHYVGGEAVSAHIIGTTPSLVINTWSVGSWVTSPNGVTTSTGSHLATLVAHFTRDGRPGAEETAAAPQLVGISPPDMHSVVVATASGPNGEPVVLMRLARFAPDPLASPPAYRIVVASPQGLTTIPVSWPSLFDVAVQAGPLTGNARMSRAGTGFVVVSTHASSVRICRVGAGAATAQTVQIGGPGTALPGIVRLTVASLVPIGAFWSIALTAELDLPGLGGVSVGAVLRLDEAGRIDAQFGDAGLWVSPLTSELRQLTCIGGFPGGIVGTQGSEAVAIAIGTGGSGVDETFATGGVARFGFGAPILSATAADDGEHTYVFARTADGTASGCRFDRTGTRDPGFGNGGRAALPSDGSPLTPHDAKIINGRIVVAATRQVDGLDCDRIPTLVELDVTTGRPVTSFGAGGLTLHAAVGKVAAIARNGSVYSLERRHSGSPVRLRRTDSSGRFQDVIDVPLPSGIVSEDIRQLWPLNGGGLLVGGHRGEWFARLDPTGRLDPAFGTNGFVVPATANVPAERHFADAAIVGEMSDGRILIHCADFGIARLHPDGSLDTSYAAATGNFIAPKGFDYIAFPDSMKHQGATLASTWMQLEPDGSIIVALGSRRVSGNPNLEIGLRRIDPTGAPDPAFGLGEGGLLSVPNAARAKLYTPRGTTSPDELFTRADPVGIEWLGGMLYLAVSAVAGAGLGVDVLVIVRWHPDGTTDYGFNTAGPVRAAHQEAGFHPDRAGYRPSGMLAASDDRAYVFGTGGWIERRKRSASVVHRPEPALFRVSHPAGIDTSFGRNGADRLEMPEFEASVVAARIVRTRRSRSIQIRFVSADLRSRPHPSNGRQYSNFGVIGQFTASNADLERPP